MKIDIELIKELLESDTSAYSIEQATSVSRMSISKYRNGQADIMNMTLKNALGLQKFISNKNRKEETDMKKLLMEQLEDLRTNEDWLTDETLLDWYHEPETNTLRFEDSGMGYQGDDKNAVQVYQTEGMEIISEK